MSGTEILVILMLAGFFGLLMLGVPVALTLATTGFVFGFMGLPTCSTCCRRASTAWSPTTSGWRFRCSCSWA